MGFTETFFSRVGPMLSTFFWVLITLIFFGVGIYGYYSFSPKLKEAKFKDVANLNDREKTVDILFFSTNWCPSCKAAKPEWVTFSQMYEGGKSLNGYLIKCQEMDCSDNESPEVNNLIMKYEITGVPKVKMLMDNLVIDFDSKITADNLNAFVVATIEGEKK